MEIIRNHLLKGAADKPIVFDVHYVADQVKKPVIIYIHGFNGFKDWGNFDLIADHFACHGYCFVKMNLSHNGTTVDSPAEFTDLQAYSENNYTRELFDVQKMIDWICAEKGPCSAEIDTSRIILMGHSRGGGIAIIKAREDKRVKALITWASVAECKTPWANWDQEKLLQWMENGVVLIENKRTHQQMPIKYQLYEDYQSHSERLNIREAFMSLEIPLQVCHGTQDEAVPYAVFLQFQKWKPGAAYVSIDADHVFGRKHPDDKNIIPEKCMQVIEQNLAFLTRNGF